MWSRWVVGFSKAHTVETEEQIPPHGKSIGFKISFSRRGRKEIGDTFFMAEFLVKFETSLCVELLRAIDTLVIWTAVWFGLHGSGCSRQITDAGRFREMTDGGFISRTAAEGEGRPGNLRVGSSRRRFGVGSVKDMRSFKAVLFSVRRSKAPFGVTTVPHFRWSLRRTDDWHFFALWSIWRLL